jgi:hypothetical protein
MVVRQHWTGPDAQVFHSEWWLREHWGRSFDVLAVIRPPRSAIDTPQITHSYIALRKRDVAITKAELERLADDPREVASLQTSLRLARSELAQSATTVPPRRWREVLSRRFPALRRLSGR